MTDDRRSSVRRAAALPFAWCEIAPDAAPLDICDALGVPRAITRSVRIAELADGFDSAVAGLNDRAAAHALRALEERLALLEQALLAETPQPPPQTLEVSADGLGFMTTRPLADQATLGMHLVLPPHNHLILKARVTHSLAAAGQWRVGAVLLELDDATARRLTRFAIGR